MAKFLVLYRAPISVLDQWMSSPAEDRAAGEKKMMAEWDTWLATHAGNVLETAGTGKTKLVTKDGVSDSRNDVMLYSIVEAESHDAAAKMFEGHTHFDIPEATIEVMAVNPLKGM